MNIILYRRIQLMKNQREFQNISVFQFWPWNGRPDCRLGSRPSYRLTCTVVHWCTSVDRCFGWLRENVSLFISVDRPTDRCCPTVKNMTIGDRLNGRPMSHFWQYMTPTTILLSMINMLINNGYFGFLSYVFTLYRHTHTHTHTHTL